MAMWDIRESGIPIRGSNNVMFTQGLFFEYSGKDGVYTLKNEDIIREGKSFVSFYKIYMESSDEYEAALRLVGSMQHWRKLCQLSWFMDGDPVWGWEGLNQMRSDMSARDKSMAKTKLMEAMESGNVTAMRALYGESAPKKQPANKKLSTVDSGVNASILSDIRRIGKSE